MRSLRQFITILLIASTLTGCQTSSPEPGTSQINWDDHESRAEQLVMAVVNGDYSIATEGFNSEMKRSISAKDLQQIWEDLVKEAGEFVSVVRVDIIPHDEYLINEVITEHKNMGINTRVVFTEDNLVAGLFFSFVSSDELTP